MYPSRLRMETAAVLGNQITRNLGSEIQVSLTIISVLTWLTSCKEHVRETRKDGAISNDSDTSDRAVCAQIRNFDLKIGSGAFANSPGDSRSLFYPLSQSAILFLSRIQLPPVSLQERHTSASAICYYGVSRPLF